MLEGQKCLIIGSGISGIGAAQLLSHFDAEITLYDSNEKLNPEEIAAKLPEGVHAKCITGELPETIEMETQALILSPGVPTDIPLVVRMRDRGVFVLGEIELAYLAEKGTVAAVTGTNGKTTTTTLLGEIMKA